MSRRAIVDLLAARLAGQLWDPTGVPVVAITITHIGDLWSPAHLALTARQAMWLAQRLGVPAPEGMDDPGVYLPDDHDSPAPEASADAAGPAAPEDDRPRGREVE